MIRSAVLLSFSRFVLLMLFTGILVYPSRAMTTAGSDTLRLTEQKVKDWIETRIVTNKLQNEMKANASEYDNVIQAFFKKRKKLLESRGWSEQEFETVEKRIGAATSAMDMAEDLEATKEEHDEKVAGIKENEYYSDKQKKQMIKAMRMMREEKRKRFIEPTKPDWPAVRPYRGTLEELTDWVAGNIPDPPELP